MVIKIQVRRGTDTEWTDADPVLDEGEIGFETNTGKLKLGDGSTPWTALDYFPEPASLDFEPTGNITSDNIAAALVELDNAIQGVSSDLGDLNTTLSDAIDTKLDSAAEFAGQVSGTYDAITVAEEHGSGDVLFHHTEEHLHDGSDNSGVLDHSVLTGTDTDTSELDIHHTIGTESFQSAAGNHTHPSLVRLYTTNDQTVTASTALATASALNIVVPANTGTNVINAVYRLPITISNTTTAFKVAWTVPTGGTLIWSGGDSTGGTVVTSAANVGTTTPIAATTNLQFVQLRAYYAGTAAGTVAFKFAQNAVTAGAITTLKRGAFVEYVIQ